LVVYLYKGQLEAVHGNGNQKQRMEMETETFNIDGNVY